MNEHWLANLKTNLPVFLSKLKKDKYSYFPVLDGNTLAGTKLELGLSCYALKIFIITNSWKDLDKKSQESWINYINSFQQQTKVFPTNSFIDNNYLEFITKPSPKQRIKELTKKILNKFTHKEYVLMNDKLNDFIKAETKQAISTLNEINQENVLIYDQFPKSKDEINDYLNSLDWTKPWNAGAQFSALCVFVSTQISSKKERVELSSVLEEFILSIVDQETGVFYKGDKPKDNEIINGAMKVITGLDWINAKIPFPDKLLNTFLKIEPLDDGCDLVDIVYVIYMCSRSTDYKNNEVKNYFENILSKIEKHYFHDLGGFSYFINRSQTHYYGVNISKGFNEPDIHGTLLLVWAISIISQVLDLPTSNWKVLKP